MSEQRETLEMYVAGDTPADVAAGLLFTDEGEASGYALDEGLAHVYEITVTVDRSKPVEVWSADTEDV